MLKYTFTKPLKYGNKSMVAIELNQPTVRHMSLLCQIKEGYNTAQLDILKRVNASGVKTTTADPADGKENKPSPEEIEEGIKGVLNMACSGTDKIYDNIKALYLSTGIAKIIDSTEKEPQALSPGYLDRMSLEDFIDMSAKYIAAFISPAS